jgi:hypothetical protein
VSTARSVQSYIHKFREGASATYQAGTLVDFASKPPIVITAGREHDRSWLAAGQASGAVHQQSARVVVDATHASLILDKTDAAAASQGISDVVAAVQSSRPLE